MFLYTVSSVCQDYHAGSIEFFVASMVNKKFKIKEVFDFEQMLSVKVIG